MKIKITLKMTTLDKKHKILIIDNYKHNNIINKDHKLIFMKLKHVMICNSIINNINININIKMNNKIINNPI
jgi:hypothetical protein